METSLLFIILLIVVSVSTIFFFIKRNQEDKKDFMEKLIKDDEVSIPKEHDTEVDPTDWYWFRQSGIISTTLELKIIALRKVIFHSHPKIKCARTNIQNGKYLLEIELRRGKVYEWKCEWTQSASFLLEKDPS